MDKQLAIILKRYDLYIFFTVYKHIDR